CSISLFRFGLQLRGIGCRRLPACEQERGCHGNDGRFHSAVVTHARVVSYSYNTPRRGECTRKNGKIDRAAKKIQQISFFAVHPGFSRVITT
ncbi:MAG: hypothetical protein Q4F30_10430, partial [Akkermansia sp.]|nr:hypothetical protein [Akkermansia sp.]